MLLRCPNARHARALWRRAPQRSSACGETNTGLGRGVQQKPSFATTAVVRAQKGAAPSKYDENYGQDQGVLEGKEGHEDDETFDILEDEAENGNAGLTNEQGLPLPPFMRPPRRSNRFSKLGIKDEPYTPGNEKTLRKKRREAPFATALWQNPYAHTLAVPVRECSFTGARIPRSCLVDLHLQEDATGEKVELLPLGLAAQMVSKKRPDHSLSEDELAAAKAWNVESRSRAPSGSATYIIARKEAFDYVSADTKRRLRRYAVGRRVNQTLEKHKASKKLAWRGDMGDFVLESMRKVLVRRLRYWLDRKGPLPDNEGIIAQLPGNGGLERLDQVDNVTCVLRVTPPDPASKVAPEDEENGPVTSADERATQVPVKPPRAKKSDRGKDSDGLVGSETFLQKDGHWQKADEKTFPFLSDTLPLSAPDRVPTLYFPTVRYRNRRVPIYSLPRLLGEQVARELVQNTSLVDSVYITVTSSASSVQPQMLLLKLHAYLAGTKAEAPKL